MELAILLISVLSYIVIRYRPISTRFTKRESFNKIVSEGYPNKIIELYVCARKLHCLLFSFLITRQIYLTKASTNWNNFHIAAMLELQFEKFNFSYVPNIIFFFVF